MKNFLIGSEFYLALCIIDIGCLHGFESGQIDVKNALLQKEIYEEIFMN